MTIPELAEPVAVATGLDWEIVWDAIEPDGMPKVKLDVGTLKALGWQVRIPLAEMLTSTVALFRE